MNKDIYDQKEMKKRFPSNSNIEKKESKPIKLKGSASIAKKGFFDYLKESIFTIDLESIRSHILFDVLMPELRDTISDTIDGIKNAILYPGYSAPKRGYADRERYSRVSSSPKKRDSDAPWGEKKQTGYSNLKFQHRTDAEEVLNELRRLIHEYKVATVSDLYETANVPMDDRSYTTQSYGWDEIHNLNDATIDPVPGGYLLNLPKPRPVK